MFKNEQLKKEFVLVASLTFLLLSFVLAFMTFIRSANIVATDIYWYFNLQNPEGGTLAYPFFALSYFRILKLVAQDLPSFYTLFGALSFGWLLLITVIFFRLHLAIEELIKGMFVVAPLLVFIPSRVEVVSIALTLASVFLFLKNKRWMAWLLLVIAVYIKFFPAFLIPFYLIMELTEKEKNLKRPALFILFTVLLLFIPENIASLLYQSERDIRVETLGSDILLIVDHFINLNISVDFSHGAHNIVLPSNLSVLVPLATVFQFLSVGVIWVLFLIDTKRLERLWVYLFLLFGTAVLMGKMFSPQFMLWQVVFSFPLLSDKELRYLFPLLIMLSLCTLYVSGYEVFYEELLTKKITGICLLTIRNLFSILVLGYAFWIKILPHVKTDFRNAITFPESIFDFPSFLASKK